MRSDLSGKAVLVTGAGSGFGRATSLLLAAGGARVAAADLNVAAAEETADLVREAGAEAIALACDVASGAQVEAAVAATVARFGRLDGAVNNAGIEGAVTPLADLSAELWQRTIDINLSGVFHCLKHELRAMQAQAPAGGAIVNVSSVLGVVAFAGGGDYVAAKHGVIGLTKTAALEGAPHGIRVNAVLPGFCETPMAARGRAVVGDDVYAVVAQLHALGRLGTAEEIAQAIRWLLSDAASFITGASLEADGGYLAR